MARFCRRPLLRHDTEVQEEAVLSPDCLSLHRPASPSGAAVVVLAGSSGALEVERAALLAARRWRWRWP